MKKTLTVLSWLLAVPFYLMAQQINLEQIVVTPYRYPQAAGQTCGSLTVIGQEDIENGNPVTVLDSLRVVPGIVVRDWYGNSAKASIDIRGFGEQAAMNSVVLIDSRRINEVDLSGVDWSQIPLSQVERIEVIRGGSGAVLYGDNAVSGVVNIITKKGRGKPKLSYKSQYGSYNFDSEELSLSGSLEKLSYQLTGSRIHTHGYRNNSYLKSYDFGSKLEYAFGPDWNLRFDSGFHKADFGLPGNLSGTDLEVFDRTHSKYGDDYVKEKDYYFTLGLDKDFGQWGESSVDLSFRNRDAYSYFLGANAGWNPILKSYIETFSLTSKHAFKQPFFGHDNSLIAGIDIYQYDYSADTYNLSDQLQDFNDINKTTYAAYFQNEFSIFEKLKLIGGYRREKVSYDFDYHDNSGTYPDIDRKSDFYQKAYNSGLVYSHTEQSKVFLNISRSFRTPATDEYFTWGSLNLDLKPQVSDNFEIGTEQKFNDNFQAGLSLFRMDLENELYYNPTGGPFAFGANENYNKTRRDGIEFSFDAKFFSWLELYGNYTYLKATFRGDSYAGNTIPMVPRNKVLIGMRWLPLESLKIDLSTNCIDEKFYINDQANRYDRIGAYQTINLSLSYSRDNWKFLAGVNNLASREYSEYGVRNATTGAYNLYPNPTRNFIVKVNYEF
ncbi:MAG: TonB-dependent receptor [Candidatus Omnitrophica bacterium]|nr:TonB-dependent receptor [Candidatus Omnitrophota bacterium]